MSCHAIDVPAICHTCAMCENSPLPSEFENDGKFWRELARSEHQAQQRTYFGHLVSPTSSLRRRIMMASSRTIFSSAVLEEPLTSRPNGPGCAAQYLRCVRCNVVCRFMGTAVQRARRQENVPRHPTVMASENSNGAIYGTVPTSERACVFAKKNEQV